MRISASRSLVLFLALVAVAHLDYYFVDPLFSFRIDSAFDIFGLASFLVSGLAVTRLVTKFRIHKELARLQHERLHRLYQLAQQSLTLELNPGGVGSFLQLFCVTFGIRAVCLFDAADAEIYIGGTAGKNIEKRTGEAFIHGKDFEIPEHELSTRCIRVGARVIGAIGFEGLEDSAVTAGPLAALQQRI